MEPRFILGCICFVSLLSGRTHEMLCAVCCFKEVLPENSCQGKIQYEEFVHWIVKAGSGDGQDQEPRILKLLILKVDGVEIRSLPGH